MKTPDEIKKGLEICNSSMDCNDCPYLSNRFCIPSCKCSRNADALALIQELEDDIDMMADKLTEMHETLTHWISVDERLPEDDVDVIVYAVSNHGGYEIVITFHTHTLYGFNIEGWMPPWQYFSRDYTITHWMPMPEPPKEDVKK